MLAIDQKGEEGNYQISFSIFMCVKDRGMKVEI
jgi:hypothetical protein